MPRSITGTLPRRRTARVAALLIAPATALTVMSGCSAGQVTQTGAMVPPIPGTNVDSRDGLISVRSAMIKYNAPTGYAAGGTAPVVALLVNNDTASAITLRGVTAAESAGGRSLGTVALTGGAANIDDNPPPGAPGGTADPSAPASSVAPSASGSASAPAGAPPSGSAEPTTSGAPSAPADAPALNLRIPPNSLARLAPEYGAYLAVTGLTRALKPGDSAFLTFTFEGKEPIPVPVPFEVPLSPPARATPAHNGEGEE